MPGELLPGKKVTPAAGASGGGVSSWKMKEAIKKNEKSDHYRAKLRSTYLVSCCREESRTCCWCEWWWCKFLEDERSNLKKMRRVIITVPAGYKATVWQSNLEM